MNKLNYLVRVAMIGAIYVILNIIFAPISYGPVQVRIAEALVVLPFIDPSAIIGLFIGCILANIYGGLGMVDIIGGSLCTLIAAYLTSKMKNPKLAPLPPVLINAFGVSIYLHLLFDLPYWITVLYIGIGEVIACYILGYPLLILLIKNKKRLGLNEDKLRN
ncbi:MAG: QueT transporter family protein [Candidatus Atribacteria bacterium]|nr:QueT transporter family protein [Candidatus Atribacteria bacterium]MCK4309029.1 QueT transporter family protein [Candidatus Atribacteria bacterium]